MSREGQGVGWGGVGGGGGGAGGASWHSRDGSARASSCADVPGPACGPTIAAAGLPLPPALADSRTISLWQESRTFVSTPGPRWWPPSAGTVTVSLLPACQHAPAAPSALHPLPPALCAVCSPSLHAAAECRHAVRV